MIRISRLCRAAIIAAVAFAAASAHASSGIFKGFVVINANGGGNAFYQTHGGGAITAFGGLSLGTFDAATGSLILNGYEVDTFQNSGDDIQSAFGDFRIYKQGSTAPSFTENGVPFNSDLGGGDKRWQATGQGTQILSGPLDVGTYNFEVFLRAHGVNGGNGFDIFDTNGGSNYIATFTISASTFTYNAGSGSTATAANWSVSRAPGNGHDLHFATATTTAVTNSLTSANSLTFDSGAGAFTISNGTLSVGAGGITNSSSNNQTLNVNLTLGANQTFNATNGQLTFGDATANSGNGLLALNGKQLTINATNSVTFNKSAIISGNGDITKTGAGTLTFNAANTFTGDNTNNRGQIFITNGTVRAGNSAALGTQTGGVSIDLGDSVTSGTTTHFSNNVSLLANSNLTIPNQIFVDTNTGSSTRTIGSDGTTGPVTFSGNVLLSGTGTPVATLTAASGGDVTFSGVIGASGFANGSVLKSGAGTAIFTNSNLYTGGTQVTAGSLFVNNTTGSGTGTGQVVVTNSGTVLGGSGTITGNVSISSSGANLSPGASGVGSTAILHTGALTLASGSNFKVDLNGTAVGSAYDQVIASNTITFNGSNLIITAGSGLAVNSKFFILENSSSNLNAVGTFANAVGNLITASNNGDVFQINYLDTGDGTAGNDISLTLVAVPEPSTWAAGILAIAAIAFSQRRRFARLLRVA